MSLARYRWSSLVIQSRTLLPELRRCDSVAADLRFTCRANGQPIRHEPWMHRWVLPNGVRWLSIARAGDGHLLRFEQLADFTVSANFQTIQCDAAPTTRADTIRHLLLDQVLPAISSADSRFGLHASAVAIGGAAVAFLGRTGRGKSTLAAAFGLRGAPIVTDDCLILDLSSSRIAAVPTYPSLRLSREAIDRLDMAVRSPVRVSQHSTKWRLGTDTVAGMRFRRRPLPLGRLYLLQRTRRGTSPRIIVLSRRQSYIELMKFSFRLNPRDPVALRGECDRLARVTRTVPVARLHVPSDLASLPEVRAAVLADLQAAERE